MSIYKNAKTGRNWQYDFQQNGRRFYGSTGQTERRHAVEVERELKRKAKLGQLGQVDDMTLDLAAERWWQEVGQHLKSAAKLEPELERTVKLVGPHLKLTEITTSVVATAIAKRRAKVTPRGKLPSPITVNREVKANLRRILNHAAGVWEVQGLPRIAWRKLHVTEPKPKIRGDFTAGELAATIAALPAHWRDFAGFAARYGLRLGEMFFHPDAVDVERGRLLIAGRKGDDDHGIPLLADDVAMLAARIGRARAAKLDTVWFRDLKGGRLKALTYNGAGSAIRTAFAASGLRQAKGARVHDLRHHAGTQILRASKNLKVAQRLLGHASIATTMRYAHALDDDVRAGLEALAGAPPATPAPAEGADQTPTTATGTDE